MLKFLFGIIDIGSTGTRFNIFGFSKSKTLLKYEHYEVKGGLHKMDNIEITNSIHKLTTQIPQYVYKIPIGVYCTAGFRHPLDFTKLTYIKNLLTKFNIKEYGILSGEYEAYLGYESLKFFLKDPDFVLIDMGGKSTQVATINNYKSYRIGITNLKDIDKIKHIYPVDNKLPIYISSGLTKDREIRIRNIKNRYLRKFLNKLGIKKNLVGVKINWTLGMSLRFFDQFTNQNS